MLPATEAANMHHARTTPDLRSYQEKEQCAVEQWLEDWGSPDSLYKACLVWVFDSGSVAVIAFMIVNGFLGYREMVKSALAGFRGARRSMPHITRRPSSAGTATLAHITVVTAQLLWVYTTVHDQCSDSFHSIHSQPGDRGTLYRRQRVEPINP